MSSTPLPEQGGEQLEERLDDISTMGRTQMKREVMELIRTEKLKLLDEVIHQSTVNLKSAKAVAGWAEIRKEQLEAEL